MCTFCSDLAKTVIYGASVLVLFKSNNLYYAKQLSNYHQAKQKLYTKDNVM